MSGRITRQSIAVAKKIGEFFMVKCENDYAKACETIRKLCIVRIEAIHDCVIIETARPGMMIGRKGTQFEELQRFLGLKISLVEAVDWIEDYIFPLDPEEEARRRAEEAIDAAAAMRAAMNDPDEPENICLSDLLPGHPFTHEGENYLFARYNEAGNEVVAMFANDKSRGEILLNPNLTVQVYPQRVIPDFGRFPSLSMVMEPVDPELDMLNRF